MEEITDNINDTTIPQHLQAFVFGSHKDRSRCCGQALSLRQLVSQSQITCCPACGKSVGYVHDGTLEAKQSNISEFVYFKYNKMHFRLSVASSDAITSKTRPSWLWRSLFGGSISNNPLLETTAQARIRSVLCLSNEMKVSFSLQYSAFLTLFKTRRIRSQVLSKGKVLYPSSNRSDEDISRDLKDHSLRAWSSQSAPSLMVMGTPACLQHAWLRNEQFQLEKDKQPRIVRFGLAVLVYSVRVTAGFLSSALGWMQRSLFGEQQLLHQE